MLIKSFFPPLPPLPEVNLHHVLFGRPDQAEWPDYTIQIEAKTGRKRTYKEMVHRIDLGATALSAKVSDGGLGLSADGGEMIGLLGENSLEYFDIVLSLLKVTTPFAPISTFSTRFELVHALKLTKATRLFVDAKLLKNVLAAIDDPDVHITSDKIYILSGPPVKGRQSFNQLIEAAERKKLPLAPIHPAKKDTLAYLVMSSGTSGLPKAVMITHGNVICSLLQSIVAGQAAEPYSVSICPLPMFHSYGLHAYILRATLFPATYVILEKWNTAQYLKAIAKYRATHLTLVPSMVHALVNHPDVKTTDFHSVVAINSGAAYLPVSLAERMGRLLKKTSEIVQGYGLSEGAWARPPPDVTGILIPGLEARIVRDDGETDADTGEVGELWLRGCNVSPGYWNNPEANAKTFFRVDEKGYFFFADRGKDTLKVSGVQVSPKEIEDVLFAHPEKLISDVTVAGVSGGRTDDEKVPRAWIVLSSAGKKKGAPAVIKALEKWHQESLSKYKWLRGGFEVVKTTMRRVLQDQYEQRAKKTKAKL
ncbi:hypothetical protein B0H14DRAFT_3082262 [Mycena olivaceomarginata]|nr:hypothetical protein B0H14DRAFT_3082262 [Mycena olivaceomarginata]